MRLVLVAGQEGRREREAREDGEGGLWWHATMKRVHCVLSFFFNVLWGTVEVSLELMVNGWNGRCCPRLGERRRSKLLVSLVCTNNTIY